MNILSQLKKAKNDKDTRNVLLNMIVAFAIRGGSLFIALFTTPAYIAYFSNDAILGVWFTILSVLAWILNFDMGIGNGVRNRLVKSLGENDYDESKRIVSSAYIFLCFLSFVIIVAMAIIIPMVNWNEFLGISETELDSKVLKNAMFVVFCSIIFQFILRLITSITYAMQNSYMPNLLHFVTNTIMLVYVLCANGMGINGNIIHLAIVYFLAVNAPLIIVTVFLFSTKLKKISPSFKAFNINVAKSVLSLGVGFLYLQLIAMLLDNTASLLISNLLGSEQVVDYQLYYKLFHMIGTIISIAIVPMWSAITKAFVDKRFGWLKKSIYGMYGVVIISFVFQLLVVVLLQFIFDIWLGENTRETNYFIGLVFALYATCCTWQQVCSYIENGLGKIKIQTICLTCGVIVSFSFSLLFAQSWGSYVAVVIGMVLGYIPSCIVQTIYIIRMCKKFPIDGN